MPRNLIPSDKSISKAATAAAKGGSRRLLDGDGLYLLLFADGASHGWRFDYRRPATKKRNTLSVGVYPDTGLALARKKADALRAQVAEGTDPAEIREAAKVERKAVAEAQERADQGLPPIGSFEHAAREFHALKFPPDGKNAEWSASYAGKWLRMLEKHAFPWIGRKALADIEPAELLTVIQRIEQAGHLESSTCVREYAGQVFMYGIAKSWCKYNPAPSLKGLVKKKIVQSYGATIDKKQLGPLLVALWGYSGNLFTRTALKLQAMLFQRPGNVRAMEWAHLDLDAAMWSIPAHHMKRSVQDKAAGKPHKVPLPRQAVALLRELQPVSGHGRYVFPGIQAHDRPMSDGTLNKALRSLGYASNEQTAHGFRATARTIMVEELGIRSEVIEAQLAHAKKDANGESYNRAQFMTERAKMMQTWADYLDGLRKKAESTQRRAAERVAA